MRDQMVKELLEVKTRPALKTAAACALATALLSACGATPPGVAATVAGDEITDEQVDAFAEVLCGLGGAAAGAAGTPTRAIRSQSLQILLGNEIAEDLGDVDAVDEREVTSTVQQLTSSGAELSDEARDTLAEVARSYAVAEVAMRDLGRASLEEGGIEPTDEEAYAEGNRLRQDYARSADIEVDPRFGRFEDGAVVPASGSLSVPVSPLAKDAAAEQPGEAFLADLPATQKCS